MTKIDTIIVTRHQGLVEWLKKQGITGEVKSHISDVDEIRGKHIVGVIPANLAQYAAFVTSVDYMMPADKRGQELSADDLDKFGAKLFDYIVTPVVQR